MVGSGPGGFRREGWEEGGAERVEIEWRMGRKSITGTWPVGTQDYVVLKRFRMGFEGIQV